MKPLLISKRQFWAWVVFESIAFVLWMLGPGPLVDWAAILILNVSMLLLLSPYERSQSVPIRTLLWIFLTLVVTALGILALKLAFPESGMSPEPPIVKIFHHPALVLPLGALWIWFMYRRWKPSSPKTS